MTEDVTIRFVDLPTHVRGLTVTGMDGHFDIYINARLPAGLQKTAMQHELRHIRRNDFGNALPISAIEEN